VSIASAYRFPDKTALIEFLRQRAAEIKKVQRGSKREQRDQNIEAAAWEEFAGLLERSFVTDHASMGAAAPPPVPVSDNTRMYYRTRWKHPQRGWIESTAEEEATEAQAQQQLNRDIDYFFDDIEIEMVRISETVIKRLRGSRGPRYKTYRKDSA
jgi:hypothetical protein